MPTPPEAFAFFAAPATRLSRFDLGIVVIYLIAITLFGLRFRENKKGAPADKSLKSYFLANNTIPWWAIALSIVSAETSTLTIISIPGVAFAGNFGFLQLVIGYMLGRIVVAALFLPRYFAGEMLTAYQLIDQRFGSFLHKVTAGLFLLTRAAAEGVRVFAVSIVVGIAIGTRDTLSIAIISALTLLYTFEGGMTAVIWTDVVQMCIYVAGTVVAIATLGSHVPGGWHTIHSVAGAAGKFHMLNFARNLTGIYTFWAGVLGGTFLTMASHGTDQLMVQRMLAARNLRESRLALLSSGVVIFIQFTLFLLIGVGLWVFYGGFGAGKTLVAQAATGTFSWVPHALPGAITPDRIFPTFIVREMPIGVAGLLVAAILAAAMSNLSAALNSLSSTTVVDFYMHLRPGADNRERGIVSKSSTVLWALVLFAIAAATVRVGGNGHVVEIALSIASVAYGCLLGVFLLGTLTRYATETGAAIGMVCGFVVNVAIWQFPGAVLWRFSGRHTASGTVPGPLPGITIPHIAYPWYTFIGAFVTFAVGTLFSLIFRKQSKHRMSTVAATATLLLLLFCWSSRSEAQGSVVRAATPVAPPIAQSPRERNGSPQKPEMPAPNFSQVDQLINDAIAAHKLPGAVVLIGHNGKVAYEHAYGNRKLAGEPGVLSGPDGKPDTRPEPMTEDTIFDMASLTKCLATATAVMQLYEAGKIASFDDPVEKYLPDFNAPTGGKRDTERAKVTLRMLLTHTSGEAPDVKLSDPWGLAAPDKAEGIHRAFTTPLKAAPGSVFTYSDINFILLGALVETLSGQREDDYVDQHIDKPLQLTFTRYLAFDRVCGATDKLGAALIANGAGLPTACPSGSWPGTLMSAIAPTAHDNEGTAATNPDFDHLLRGTVHDPTTRRMGGVAGHAGLFSTAHDVSLFAQALLDKLTKNTGPFPLKQSTLQLMTQPEQPQLPGAPSVAPHATEATVAAELRAANTAAIAAGRSATNPLLAATYPAVKNQNLRGFGWDIDTGFSKPRGAIFPIFGSLGFASFGHTGFTGTSLWIDPNSHTYVILLANAIHPRGGAPISNLRGEVATAAALALQVDRNGQFDRLHSYSGPTTPGAPSTPTAPSSMGGGIGAADPSTAVRTGIDVLESDHFAPLTMLASAHNKHLRLGLLTNQTGLDSQAHRTLDVFRAAAAYNLQLTTVFSPEHGIFGQQDTEHISAETDPATGLHVTSLYGAKDADRRPTHEQLKDLDAVVIDLQDAGVHFWTYESVLGYFLEAAAAEQATYHHKLDLVVLDRPDPVGGLAVQGPPVDAAHTGYVAYMAGIPTRHGMTYGELARYMNAQKSLNAPLTVVPMRSWQRADLWADTGLRWTPPSPNLRTPGAAILYPALGLIEATNLSVGRGTEHPFSFFGAGVSVPKTGNSGPDDVWFTALDVARTLTDRHIPGVTFTAGAETIAEDANRYPFHGQTIEAVRVTCTDPAALDSPELGIEILATLHKLYPTKFKLAGALRLVANQATVDAIARGDDPRDIARFWQPALDDFKTKRSAALLYP